MLVGNVTFTDKSLAPDMVYNKLKGDPQKAFDRLETVRDEPSLFHREKFDDLYAFIAYQEIRIFCHKPSHRRTVHFVLKGDGVVDYLTFHTAAKPTNWCGKIRFLKDDTFLMQQAPCTNLISNGGQHLYYDFVYVYGKLHVNLLNKRIECDDYYTDLGEHSPGTWNYYVR